VEDLPRCYEAEWRPPCAVEFSCGTGDPFDESTCEHALPRDCPEVEKLDCGNMPDRINLDLCLTTQRICSRAAQLGKGLVTAAHEYVDGFDFASGPLEALPGDLVCRGILSPEQDAWCSYLETVHPDASFLEATIWLARLRLATGPVREPFARIGAGPHPECRMRDGQLFGRVQVEAASFACTPEAPLPGPGDASLRLSDVAFSDTNQDGYLDAVVTVSWTGGGTGSLSTTATLTRLEPEGPLLHVRQLGPGFDCAKAATPAEKRLCHDPRLAVLDLRLSNLYGHLRQQTKRADDAERRSRLREEQQRFLEQRDADCASGDPAPCAALYRTRIGELERLAGRDRCDLSRAACD
jgi:uncharacterized protein YecT (DUF1311 family)